MARYVPAAIEVQWAKITTNHCALIYVQSNSTDIKTWLNATNRSWTPILRAESPRSEHLSVLSRFESQQTGCMEPIEPLHGSLRHPHSDCICPRRRYPTDIRNNIRNKYGVDYLLLATIATPIRCAVVLFGNGCSTTSDVVHIDGAISNSYRLPKRGDMNL